MAKKNDIINKKIITYFLIGLVIIIMGILFIIKVGIKPLEDEKDEETLNKKVDIDIGGYNQTITVKKVLNNVVVDNQKYMKIFLDIDNKKNVDSITALHQFKLIGDNNEDVTSCYHRGVFFDSGFDDMFSDVIVANQVTSGYLYCPIETSDISKLGIVVISGGSIDSNNKITYEYKEYYIDLK